MKFTHNQHRWQIAMKLAVKSYFCKQIISQKISEQICDRADYKKYIMLKFKIIICDSVWGVNVANHLGIFVFWVKREWNSVKWTLYSKVN